MEQKEAHLYQETISCSICLDLLKNPVTIPCGHSYCFSCIRSHWKAEDKQKIYTCPQCRQSFRPRPTLVKNTMLRHLVEELKKTGLQPAPVQHFFAGPEDVACDICTGRKLKAVKSCLNCPASYCEKHLQPHYDAAPLMKHKLIDPSEKLQERICPLHDEVMKMFCRTDQQCLCYLCSVDEHRGHDTVSAAAERTERQKELEVSRQMIQERIQDKEKEVIVLQQESEAISSSADQAVKKSEKIFTELIRLMEERLSDVKQQVRSQQETELSRVKEIQEKLEQEICELRRKDAELEKLSHTEDHNQFIQNYASLSKVSEAVESCINKVHGLRYFEDVMAPVWDLSDKLHHTLSEEWTDSSLTATQVDVLLLHPEYKLQRAEFLKYSCKITLDPNTANRGLLLSEGNRGATRTSQKQNYSHHPDRFTDWWQVLSRESLTGRCYWEVEWSGEAVNIAVAYDDIWREGCSYTCGFGYNDKSWSLHCDNTCYSFRYDDVSCFVSSPPSSRIGVYLDHSAGLLSFYSVSETMTLLHRVHTTFTQPLHVGLGLLRDGTIANLR